MILSVFAGTVVVAGSAQQDDTNATNSAVTQATPQVQNGSAKAMTISWFRDDGDGNGPYPVPPNEYDGNESPGIQMFANAKGDDHIAIDNSTARNPNGKWDMVALNVETSGLEELEPPESGADQSLVTQNFIDNDNWNVEISQVDGDKTLDIAANQNGYESPQLEAGTSADVPPVMVFADTNEIMTDYLTDGDPETSLYVWVDPNRATLDENGDEASFDPGEEYEATFTIHGQTQSVTFEMVEGDAVASGESSPPNSANAKVTVESSLSANTEVEMVVEPEEGENQSVETTVKGNTVLMDGENPGTVPRGTISGTFDLSGMENDEITIHVYGEDDRGGDFEELVGSVSLTVADVIDPDYEVESATIRESYPLTIAYTNPDYETAPAIGNQVGDNDLHGDHSIAYNTEGEPPYFDEMFLMYAVNSSVFEAITVSPGSNTVEKFQSSPMSLEVVQTNADGAPKRLDLSENASGVTIATDDGESDPRLYQSEPNTGLFFSFKLNEMTFFQDGEPVQPEIGDTFDATLTIETNEGVEEKTTNFTIVEGKTVIQHQGDALRLSQSDAAEVQMNSTLSAGTAVGFTLASEDGDFEEDSGELELTGMGTNIAGKSPGTPPWGTADYQFNTSELEPGTELTLTAEVVADLPDEQPDPLVLTEVPVVIKAPATGSLTLSAQSGDGSSVTVDEVELSDGGFVSVHTGSPNGPIVGSSSYLDSGTHSDVEISLDESVEESTTLYVTAHSDTNANEQFDFPTADDPIEMNGSLVSANAEYSVESGTGGETTTENTSGETTSDDTTGNEGSIPGFGIVTAIAALLTAGFVLFRRS